MDLRRWQDEAETEYWASQKQDFLLVAVPGAGKTRLALTLAKRMLFANLADRIAVVVYTERLKKQWARTAADLGLDLDWMYMNEHHSWSSDHEGVVMTYAQMGMMPALHRANVAKQRTFVILDEVHHVMEEQAWGQAAKHAFEVAGVKRLHLSGTPWHRNGYIPWIEYDENDRSKPDYEYSYGQALLDDPPPVCDVFFHEYGGVSEGTLDGSLWRMDSAEAEGKSPEDWSRWLAVQVGPDSGFAQTAVPWADRELNRIRAGGQPTAGGLVIAKDIADAKGWQARLEKETGRKPVLVHSKDPEASDKLDAFASSTERWLVAVKMVSEGVDIPRLRVLIYATWHKTLLAFLQAIGRIVRGPKPPAICFFPANPVLVKHAQQIKKARDEAMKKRKKPKDPDDDEKRPRSFFERGTSTAYARGVIHDDDQISQRELDFILDFHHREGTQLRLAEAAITWKMMREMGFVIPETEKSSPASGNYREPITETKSERKDALKLTIRKIVQSHAYHAPGDTQNTAQWCHSELNKAVGIRKRSQATEDQLTQMLELARQWYANGN